jgi:polysaccharide biosynthesis protein PslH
MGKETSTSEAFRFGMKLLFLSNEQPWPPKSGAVLRNYHLIVGLARHHDVTLVTLVKPTAARDDSIDSLYNLCESVVEVSQSSCIASTTTRYNETAEARDRLRALLSSRSPRSIRRWSSEELVDKLRRLRATTKFDAVMASRAYMGEMAMQAGFDRVLVDLPDLESVAMRRLLAQGAWYKSKPIDWGEWVKLHRYESRLAQRFWRVSVCKEEDRMFFGGGPRDNVRLIPNGTEEFPVTPQEDEVHGEMLFVGLLSYVPNIDAVKHFHDDVLPIIRRTLPEARFRIVGFRPDREVSALDDGVDCFVNASVDDLTPFYARASLAVVPMRLGSGTKLKVLEGLARGKAVVSTSFGAEGFDVRPGIDLEIADTPDAFAATCARLLSDPVARRRLGESGRARVLERYRWDVVVQTASAALR